MQQGHVAIPSVTEDERHDAMGPRERPTCSYCHLDFGRVQERERHVKDIHTPRRRCPFCNVMWTRPTKIKNHLIADHADKFAAGILEGFKALNGRGITEFLDAYNYLADMEGCLTW